MKTRGKYLNSLVCFAFALTIAVTASFSVSAQEKSVTITGEVVTMVEDTLENPTEIAIFVETDIGLIYAKALSQLSGKIGVLAGIDIAKWNAPSFHLHHNRSHFNKLCFGSNKEMDHIDLLSLTGIYSCLRNKNNCSSCKILRRLIMPARRAVM